MIVLSTIWSMPAPRLCFEPTNDLALFVQKLRPDARPSRRGRLPELTFGTTADIEKEVRGVFETSRTAPVRSSESATTSPEYPMENAIFYFDLVQELMN